VNAACTNSASVNAACTNTASASASSRKGTMRNVGNLVPPAMADGVSIGDLSEASAIEYSVLVLKVPNIVVCGHSECGAMKAVIENNARPDTPNLARWLHHAHGAALRLQQEGAPNGNLNARRGSENTSRTVPAGEVLKSLLLAARAWGSSRTRITFSRHEPTALHVRVD
jgi:Carbonic anhydrase